MSASISRCRLAWEVLMASAEEVAFGVIGCLSRGLRGVRAGRREGSGGARTRAGERGRGCDHGSPVSSLAAAREPDGSRRVPCPRLAPDELAPRPDPPERGIRTPRGVTVTFGREHLDPRG